MKKGWVVRRLSDLCIIKPPKKEARENLKPDDLVSFVPMNDLGEVQKIFAASEARPLSQVLGGYTYFADNDVLVAKITPCFENGKMGIATGLTNGVGFGSSEYVVLRSKGDIDPEYLFYFLSRDEFRDVGSHIMSGAVGHKRVPKEYFEELLIPLPPLEEQKQIVALLDEAFEGLARARANAEANLLNAHELFESYLNSVFRKGGRNWTKSTLGKICYFQGGSQPPKADFSKVYLDGYVRLIQIRDYKSDKNVVYIPKSKARRFCNATDVMIGRYGPPLFQILRGIEGAYNVALMKAAPNEDEVSKDFLFYFLKNGDILKYIIKASDRAAGQIGLNKATLEPYPISYPTLDEQKSVVKKLDKAFEEVQCLEQKLSKKLIDLNQLKQSLLQKAFAGELT